MRVPRDVDAGELITLLKKYGYVVIRQTGSHIRLLKKTPDGEHAITIPNHNPIKIGTLQSIVKDICGFNKLNNIDSFYKQI